MQRSRLKNIVNKSKEIGKGDFFEMFKKDLPSNYDFYKDDNNYRLKEAWESYGKPKSFEEAQLTGLVLGNVLASIGYNEDTDDYEYLNKGYENDSVNRDIRVWEEDMIPLVQELKNGGYLRVFDEEKNFWSYTKNPQKKEQYLENKQELIEKFKGGGKPKKVKSDLSYYDKDSDTIYYSGEKRKDRKEAYKHEYVHARPLEFSELFDYLKPYYENLDDYRILNLGGDLNYVKRFDNDPNHFYSPEELGARVLAAAYRTRHLLDYSPEFFESLRSNESKYGDNMRDLLHMYNNETLSKIFKYFRPSGGFIGGGWETEYYDPTGEFAGGRVLRKIGLNEKGDMEYQDASNNVFINPEKELEVYKQGGQMNVIPEGALHARKNNMEGGGKDYTHKGIPVMTKDGEQVAEIEKEEIIFNKSFTDFVEEKYKAYKEDKDDDIAISVGKRLVKEIFENTDDRTGLIDEIENKL